MFLACGNKPNPAKEEAYQKAASVFAADESFYPILDEELYYFTTQTLDSITPIYINEQDAVKKLMTEETWLAFTTRDFTEKERQNLKDRRFLPRAIPIAYDGLAIIVNNANPDTCITVKDFARVLKGEVSQWKELYPQNKLGEIDVVFDNPLSSTVPSSKASNSMPRTLVPCRPAPPLSTMSRSTRMPSASSAATGSTTNVTPPMSHSRRI